MTVTMTLRAKTGQYTAFGTDSQKGFAAEAGYLNMYAAWPMYVMVKQGSTNAEVARRIDAFEKCPMSANSASAPVMHRRTPCNDNQEM